jgi:hypothetical protein
MEKAGKIFIPKTILSLWQNENNLQGYIVEVTLEPA